MDRAQVLGLAPDEASARAAQGVRSWLSAGAVDGVIWGECAGSGATPYRTAVDTEGLARTCSCPSRKNPCKHVLALLLRHADGLIASGGQPPDWVTRWQSGRTQTSDPGQAKRPADPEAAARRAAQRAERVAGGLGELRQWLGDQVREGLARAAGAGYGHWDAIAARMVDAQCPGVAARLRDLASLPASGPGWEGRLLEEVAMLYLLTLAYEREAGLPDNLAATARARIGFSTRQADLVAACTDPVTGVWQVLGWRDTRQERIESRRIWLHGQHTRTRALVLSFAAGGEPLDASLPPGTSVPATIAFYPGALPLRAAVITRQAPAAGTAPVGVTVAELLREWADALAKDPWQESWPVVLADAVPAAEPGPSLIDASGDALPLHPLARPWPLLAVSGGRPLTVAAEYTPRGLWPMTAWGADGVPVPV